MVPGRALLAGMTIIVVGDFSRHPEAATKTNGFNVRFEEARVLPPSHHRANLPGDEFVVAEAEQFRLALLARGKRQEPVEDFGTLVGNGCVCGGPTSGRVAK